MHPYSGTPICPRCSKAVYLAEQVLGPGRKLYHKPCLTCMICSKRLDSFTLLEHDEQPYCKSCHLKNFGTRDLRHANLPHVPVPGEERSSSPSSPPPSKGVFPPQALLRPLNTGNTSTSSPLNRSNTNTLPRLRPNRSLTSPISPTFSRTTGPLSPTYQLQSQTTGSGANGSGNGTPSSGSGSRSSSAGTPPLPPRNANTITEEEEVDMQDTPMSDDVIAEEGQERATSDHPSPPPLPARATTPSGMSNTGRPGIGTIPRTIPLYLNDNGSSGGRAPYKHHTSRSVGAVPASYVTSASKYTASYTKDDSAVPDTQADSEETIGNGEVEEDPLSRFTAMTTTASSPGAGSGSFGLGNMTPLKQTATGTRYGVALGGGVGSPPGGVGVHMTGQAKKWGAGTPVCPRCKKSVYFAEQVKAVGKTFHKNCLRCVECNTSLSSGRLHDHDGDPFCVRCYNKLHGPQGGGYALLGKAGG
ncbi:unnamed protein product [Cyclocybe aegerita]|uniref:LIM zinc-binding domain-containing protein n=1 Tax=Cyclocybe aegerita TaxID=1973307 RepID=A0A8S0XPH9_CYCAE|nr:unnamed protein product [Cyclocybe aegerita]